MPAQTVAAGGLGTIVISPLTTGRGTCAAVSTTTPASGEKLSASLRQETYWHLPEAFKLFMRPGTDSEDYSNSVAAVLRAIKARINACKVGVDQWWTVVKDAKSSDTIAWHDRQLIQWKCQYLLVAMETVLKRMGLATARGRWRDCTQTAVDHLAVLRIFYWSKESTLRRWHNIF